MFYFVLGLGVAMMTNSFLISTVIILLFVILFDSDKKD
jgi:hypothetical protein